MRVGWGKLKSTCHKLYFCLIFKTKKRGETRSILKKGKPMKYVCAFKTVLQMNRIWGCSWWGKQIEVGENPKQEV